MSKRQQRKRERRQRHEPKRHKPSFGDRFGDRLAHAPQLVTASVVTIGLAGQAMTSGPCERPCANPTGGGGAAILPSELSIDVLPTRINYVPVIVVDAPPSGSATVRSSWPRPGV